MESSLTQSLLKTLAYFDIFDYPLTREELFRFLWEPQPLKYSEFVFALDQELPPGVQTLGGYYFFTGRKEIIGKREQKILYTEQKIAIAKRGTKKLRALPFVKALFVCNQLPVGVKKNSDIDVFIIVERGRMWTTRAWITAILSVFLLRRTNRHVEDKMCLSFYVTDENLDLSNICIAAPDVYQAYWNAQLIALYDPSCFFTKIQQKNMWVQKYLPHMFVPSHISKRWKVDDTFFSRILKKSGEWILKSHFGLLLEKGIRFLQLQKMKFLTKSFGHAENKSVVIRDAMLKFHENDRKQFFKDEWEKRWKEKIV